MVEVGQRQAQRLQAFAMRAGVLGRITLAGPRLHPDGTVQHVVVDQVGLGEIEARRSARPVSCRRVAWPAREAAWARSAGIPARGSGRASGPASLQSNRPSSAPRRPSGSTAAGRESGRWCGARRFRCRTCSPPRHAWPRDSPPGRSIDDRPRGPGPIAGRPRSRRLAMSFQKRLFDNPSTQRPSARSLSAR